MKSMKHALTSLAFLLFTFAVDAGITPGSKDLGAIWFIGDSITQSNGDGDSQGSPRKSLYDLLLENGYSFSYTGHHDRNWDGLPETGANVADNLYHYHSGISGIRIGEVGGDTGVAPRLGNFWKRGRLAVVKPNVILIMLGTNDVSNMADAPSRLKKLVAGIYQLPEVGDPTIFLATIPPNRRTAPERANDTKNVALFNAAVPGIVSAFQAQGKDLSAGDDLWLQADTSGFAAHRRLEEGGLEGWCGQY
ncbi:GDSL-type esterase/lipase family protein [Coraliomargarita algicola]|uniref:GDSL-type esterase/lipase family protein n=1 Tax=Coraliomargarita algicola TaxID=3092156 RepID=A0ABZ0RJ67_9BACT|nr:GDSL-type esterase/lipase family protein [Coraliomargarita sp. J2-16]WPJ96251.1 GDSL-type esterase/lipase family protein [Coraliomargarita sp. J2-16]